MVTKRIIISICALLTSIFSHTGWANPFRTMPTPFCLERANCEKSCTFFTIADFLYWKPLSSGLSNGLDYLRWDINNPGYPTTVRDQRPHFKWRPGLRLGGGFSKRCCDQEWYSAFIWTYYYARARNSITTPPLNPNSPGVYDLYLRSLSQTPTQTASSFSASAIWSLNYNIFDWEVGTFCCSNPWLIFKPFMGVRGGFIDQHLNDSVTWIDSSTQVTRFRNERLKNQFGFVGIRAGFDLQFPFCNHWAIYTKASGSFVTGEFSIKEHVIFNGFPAKYHHNFWRVRPNVEAGVGIERACGSSLIRVGYEIVEWFDLVVFPGLLESPLGRSTDLGLQGLQVSFTYLF